MIASDNIIYKGMGQEAALLNIKNGELYTLNETGKFIWEAVITKKDTIEKVAKALSENYDISEAKAATAISIFLKDMRSEKLIK